MPLQKAHKQFASIFVVALCSVTPKHGYTHQPTNHTKNAHSNHFTVSAFSKIDVVLMAFQVNEKYIMLYPKKNPTQNLAAKE